MSKQEVKCEFCESEKLVKGNMCKYSDPPWYDWICRDCEHITWIQDEPRNIMVLTKQRPEWILCCQHPIDKQKMWCGSYQTCDPFLIGIDHAAGLRLNKSRYVACKECVDEVTKTLLNYDYNE